MGKNSESFWQNYKLVQDFPNSCEHWEQAALLKSWLSSFFFSWLRYTLPVCYIWNYGSETRLTQAELNYHWSLSTYIESLWFLYTKSCRILVKREKNGLVWQSCPVLETRNNLSARVCSPICKQTRATMQHLVDRKKDLPEILECALHRNSQTPLPADFTSKVSATGPTRVLIFLPSEE